MSHSPHPTSEKSATSPLSASVPAPVPKRRSCAVCRTRKVRCDKQSPCSNCRRANIACVLPSTNPYPRWARRLEHVPGNVASNAPTQVIERLRDLENLVQELRDKLEKANAAASSATNSNSPESSGYQRDASPNTDVDVGNIKKEFGRLVIQDSNRSRYVSSGFWSRINDELYGLDSDSSEDEVAPEESPPPTQELQRTPSERHAFLFRHNLSPSTHDLHDFHPLPSQIPFLLDVFSENFNSIVRILHAPTLTKMVRDWRRSNMKNLTPANEALMFSIYYAAVTSMEEDDIMTNFGCTKTDLNLKFRLGLELALAKADFLNVPDLVLVQAFAIFLALLRRHDSPRFVWMMTGLVIRMGQALGLHRDGTHFAHLTPFEIEMRRRTWCVLCLLDIRASEDQGTDYSIAYNSFDTKLPLNINEEDIGPETTEMPIAREGITDMTFLLTWAEGSDIMKHMMVQSTKESAVGIEEQSQLLSEMYQNFDRRYLQYSEESGNIIYWVAVTIMRLVMAKMTLLIYLPVLFSSPSEQLSDTMKNKLLVAAIEIAEYNHALNAEQACRHWRWIYQTYTHWYAVVYLLIEISRRPLSPLVERAWVALHSSWLIPAQSHMDKNLRVWVPLRKLTAKAKTHRDAELKRLRNDPQAAEQLEIDDQKLPVPASPGTLPEVSDVVEFFRERWRQLLGMQERPPGYNTSSSDEPNTGSTSAHGMDRLGSNNNLHPDYLNPIDLQTKPNLSPNTSLDPQSTLTPNIPSDLMTGDTAGLSYNADPTTWSTGPGYVHWLWADTNPSTDIFADVSVDAFNTSMDVDGDADWYSWVESAKGMEWNTRSG